MRSRVSVASPISDLIFFAEDITLGLNVLLQHLMHVAVMKLFMARSIHENLALLNRYVLISCHAWVGTC